MKLISKIKQYYRAYQDLYWCVLPGGLRYAKKRIIAQIEEDYDGLVQLTDMNDDVFKRLSELGFKLDDEHYDVRTLLPRGQIVPYAVDTLTVQVDAKVWLDEKLSDIQQYFAAYGLAGTIEAIPTYDKERDVIMYQLRPIAINDLEELELLQPISTWCNAMYCIIVSLAVLSIILTIL